MAATVINNMSALLFITKPAIFFSYILTRNQVTFRLNNDVWFVLIQFAREISYGARSLKQQSARIHVAPFGHINLIPGQHSMLLDRDFACFAEKQ